MPPLATWSLLILVAFVFIVLALVWVRTAARAERMSQRWLEQKWLEEQGKEL